MRNKFLKIAILFYLTISALTQCSLQRDIMFPIKQIGKPPPVPAEISPVWIDTEQGKVEMWFLPGHNITKTNPGPAVIYTITPLILVFITRFYWRNSLSVALTR